jgi:tRNA 2-selenouridine synthase
VASSVQGVEVSELLSPRRLIPSAPLSTKISVSDIEKYLAAGDIIDVRSPGEFAEDFIPGAVNHPVLDDDERAAVGTVNKQQSPFEAKRMGAALVTKNIGDMIAQHFATKPKDWAPLIYCWRGGKRSGVTTYLLREIGFNAVQLDGGYKAFRARVNDDLLTLPRKFRYVTLCGCTGTGKTVLLHALARAGAQVIDLEGLANHRGSLLGAMTEPQPSQKRFDSLLWAALRALDPARPVFVESESKKIGLVQMPDSMRETMAAGRCAWLDVPLESRVAHIRSEYINFVNDPVALVDKLEPIRALRGAKLLGEWRNFAESRDVDALFASLMVDHYDPLYTKAMANNYPNLAAARHIKLSRVDEASLARAATELISAFS